MFCDKILRLFVTLKHDNMSKFFDLLRLKGENADEFYWKKLRSDFDFIFERPFVE